MVDQNLSEIRDAEVVPGMSGSNAYLVRFSEGDYEQIPKTPKHRLLLETDLLEQAEGGIRGTAGDSYVTFTADVENDRYHLTVDSNRISVPADYEDAVLDAYSDDDYEELASVHQEIVENRVRVGLMDRFMPRFSDARSEGRLRKADDGWVIDDTFIVEWSGDNYLTERVDNHVVRNGQAVQADEEHPAREITFDIPDETTVLDPNGSEVDLSGREARFLATVECLLNPQEYLSESDAEYVEEAVESVQDPIASFARTANVTGFTDEKSGLYHGHSLGKHTLDMLGVTDEAAERLFYNSFDHAGVHEMKARRSEFENAPFDVFEDAANDSSGKWDKIESTSQKAPIPQDVRNDIDSRFQ